MTHWISAAAQVRSLAKAVSTAFAASNLTPEEKAPARLEMTDMPWQAPPLIAEAKLNGTPLMGYLDAPFNFKPEALHAFWIKTLRDMWFEPSRLLRRGVHVNCGAHMPKVSVGQRAMRFSRPAGWPAHIDETAGLIFSLEVAHTAITSMPLRDVISDDYNYYGVLQDFSIIGVKDGRPACVTDWNYDGGGQIQELLRSPRGEVDYTCYYDSIAVLRSVVNVHRRRFPGNYVGIDLALQTLRLMTLGGNCPPLTQAMVVAPIDLVHERARERALWEALDAVKATMSDRSKLQVLRQLLVPEVLSNTKFRNHIYSGAEFPFCLPAGKLEQISLWLHNEYERVPHELKQTRGMK